MDDLVLQAYAAGMPAQEIIAAWLGLRPLSRICVSHAQLKTLKAICQIKKLHMVAAERSYGPCPQNPLVLISRSKKNLQHYADIEKGDKQERNGLAGRYLGYPDCCVEKYTKNLKRQIKIFPLVTLRNTEGKPDYRLNYLYNWESRVFDHERFRRVSAQYRMSHCYLIPHIPCSFTCKKSITYAEDLRRALECHCHPYGKMIEMVLKKPVLFLNDFDFFPLTGKTKKDTLKYQGYTKIHGHLPRAIIKPLEDGNSLKKRGSRLTVFNNDTAVALLPAQAILFPFA